MTIEPEAASAMAAQPVPGTTKPQAASAADLTPVVAWSRRVRRIGGFIQAAFAAFWLARASLAIRRGRLPRPRRPPACLPAAPGPDQHQ